MGRRGGYQGSGSGEDVKVPTSTGASVEQFTEAERWPLGRTTTVREAEIKIGDARTLTIRRANGALVLMVEDPHSVAIVELTKEAAIELVDELERWIG